MALKSQTSNSAFVTVDYLANMTAMVNALGIIAPAAWISGAAITAGGGLSVNIAAGKYWWGYAHTYASSANLAGLADNTTNYIWAQNPSAATGPTGLPIFTSNTTGTAPSTNAILIGTAVTLAGVFSSTNPSPPGKVVFPVEFVTYGDDPAVTQPSGIVPKNGDKWLDINSNLIKMRLGGVWVTIATLSGANAFTSTISFTAITPAQIGANQNDYNPGTTGTFYRVSSGASWNVTGLANGADGRLMILANVGAFNIVLTHQDVASAAANRIITPTAASLTLAANQNVILIYDSTTARWRIIGWDVTNGAGKIAAALGGAASTLATLDGSTLVVQNPANATATPTASKIPIADANGELRQWTVQQLVTSPTSLGGFAIVAGAAMSFQTPGGVLVTGRVTEAFAQIKPIAAGKLRNLRVYVSAAAVTVGTFKVTVAVNGVATALEITEAASTTGWHDDADTITYAAEICFLCRSHQQQPAT